MNSSNELESTESTETQTNNNLISMDEEKITISYLQQHADFFNQHRDLLLALKIPHISGGATSLIERQVSQLREQNIYLTKNLDDLISIAKDNESSNQRMHRLTLELLSCGGFDKVESVLDGILCEEFSVDSVALKLFPEPAASAKQAEHLLVKNATVLLRELEKILNKRKPACGVFKNLPLQPLFQERAEHITSIAVIPLFVEKNSCFGALVLGSQNINRFNASMGTHFLEQLGEILSHALYRLIQE